MPTSNAYPEPEEGQRDYADLYTLPPEIRLRIYHFVFADYTACPNDLTRAWWGHRLADTHSDRSDDVSGALPGLLLTCSQVRNEALPVYRSVATFEVMYGLPMDAALLTRYTATLSHAQHLQIHCERSDFMLYLADRCERLHVQKFSRLRCQSFHLVDCTLPMREPDHSAQWFLSRHGCHEARALRHFSIALARRSSDIKYGFLHQLYWATQAIKTINGLGELVYGRSDHPDKVQSRMSGAPFCTQIERLQVTTRKAIRDRSMPDTQEERPSICDSTSERATVLEEPEERLELKNWRLIVGLYEVEAICTDRQAWFCGLCEQNRR